MEELAVELSEPSSQGALIWAQQDLERAQSHIVNGAQAVVYTHRAPDKETPSEDVAALIPLPDEGCVLVIADGVGGMPAGEQASRLAVEAVCASLARASEPALVMQCLIDGIDEANRAILARGAGGATTLAMVEMRGNTIRSYHVGDSMILVTGQRGKIKQQTVAHSPVGYAVESGMLDVDDAVHHAERHLVSNIVGTAEMRMEIGPTLTLASRDTLVVASDGLADNLYVEEIVERARKGSLEQAAEQLATLARRRMRGGTPDVPGHADDLSFILLRLAA